MKRSKKDIQPALFENDPALKEQEKVRRDELNLALSPLAHFPGKKSSGIKYELLIKIDDERHVRLISSKAGGGIPEGPDLDYLYSMMDMLYEQTRFEDDTIYFFITELITKAGREISKQEIERAVRAIRRYRHLVVQSNALKVMDETTGKATYSEKEVSYIQEFHIVGETFKRGKRKHSDTSLGGKCMVVFSKYFMQHIVSDQTSKPLNYSLMMKLKNPKGKKLFRLIDAFRYIEGHIGDNHHELVSKDLLELARRIPLSDYEMEYASRMKRSIDPIHEELKTLQYITDYYYEDTNEPAKIVYVFSKFKTDQASAYNELLSKGITAKVAEEMALTYDAQKIFDCLKYCEYKKEEKGISPGYIRTTIVDSNHDWIKSYLDKKDEENRRERVKNDFEVRQKMKMFYDLAVERAVNDILMSYSEQERSSLRQMAEKGLQKPGAPRFTSESAKESTIQGAICQAIKKNVNFTFPSFDQWLVENKGKYDNLV